MQQDSFTVPGANIRLSYLSYDQLVQRFPSLPTNNQFNNRTILTDNVIAGVLLYGDYGTVLTGTPNGVTQFFRTFTVAAPCLSTQGLTPPNGIQGVPVNGQQAAVGPQAIADFGNTPGRRGAIGYGPAYADLYGVQFAANTPQAAYNAYQSFLDGNSQNVIFTGSQQFTGQEFSSAIYGCSVTGGGVNPLVGTPESLQFSAAEYGLDLAAQSVLSEIPGIENTEAPWGIGFRYGRVTRSGVTGNQYDARINRSWRVLEGNRSRLTLDLPISYQDTRGAKQFRISAAASLEIPLKANWSVEPRLSYGYVDANDQKITGQLASASVASRLLFRGVGRGTLTVGNMVGVTKVTHVKFDGRKVNGNTENVVFRNGFAYEMPVQTRVGGRTISARGSYAYTKFAGDALFLDNLHEVTASVGVRTRGDNIRNSFEVLRVGLMGKFAKNYEGVHIFMGYRF